jgi:hypothetical protein
MCIRRGSISGAALASSPLWPRCAAIQPGNLRFGGGEALSHDAQSDALRLSEKSEKSGRDHLPSESLPGLHSGAAHAARSLRKSFGTCLPPFEFRPLTCFVSALPRQPIKGVAPRASVAFFVLPLNGGLSFPYRQLCVALSRRAFPPRAAAIFSSVRPRFSVKSWLNFRQS